MTSSGDAAGRPPSAGALPDPDTIRIVSFQLGRPPRGLAGVAVRCPHGMPAVLECRPYLEDGAPFPTLLYLSCPTAVARVSTAESEGAVERLRDLARGEHRQALDGLVERYRLRRRELGRKEWSASSEEPLMDEEARSPCAVDQGAVFGAGIGGPGTTEKATCLHAYVAAMLADRAGRLGPPDDRPARDRLARALLGPLGLLWCEDGRCARSHAARVVTAPHPAEAATSGPAWAGPRERRAAIDLGTNSVRLLVADLPGPASASLAPVTLVRTAEVTRLGEGLHAAGLLGEAAMARTAGVVARFAGEARALGAGSITLVGTSATRDAANGPAFVRGLGEDLGITAGVAAGEMEAKLTYSGATLDLPADVLLMDLGGGSTELVRLQPDGRLHATSVNVGCVRATERWITTDPPSSAERAAVRREAAEVFAQVAHGFRGATLIAGVAGTVTTLSALIHGLAVYDPDAVHLSVFTREQLGAELERLGGMTLAERASLPTMQPGRAGVIVAGAEILAAAMDILGYGEVVVSERDILDGIILASR